MAARRGSISQKRTFSASWTAVVQVKAKLRPSEKRKTDARSSLAFSKGKRSALLSRLWFAIKMFALRITARSRRNSGRHTLISPMRLNTEFGVGREAAVRLRAKRSAASRRARLQKKYY